MQTYATFSPTSFDPSGAFLRGDDDEQDRQSWLVAPVSRTRDSGALADSNFEAALERLGGESDTLEVHRFGHWGPGWFEIILLHPSRQAEGEAIEDALQAYPVLDEEDFSRREGEQADETWKNCYSVPERVAYIREHRSQFDFRDFADMLGCIRGNYFAGYASDLIS